MLRPFIILLLSVFVFSGVSCTPAPTDPGNPEPISPSPVQTADQPLQETPGQSPGQTGAESKEDLLAQTRSAIEEKNLQALLGLHKLEDSPQTYLADNERTLASIISDAEKVQSVEEDAEFELPKAFPPIAMDGSTWEPSVQMLGAIKITYQDGGRVNRLFYGTDQGRYYFMGLKRVGEAVTDQRVRVSIGSMGNLVSASVNDQPINVASDPNGVADQDIVPQIKKGENTIQVTWKPADENAPQLGTPQVEVRLLDATGKNEIWRKKMELSGESGSGSMTFEI